MGIICSCYKEKAMILKNYSPLINRRPLNKSPKQHNSPKIKLLSKRCAHCAHVFHKKTKNIKNSPNIYCSPDCSLMNNKDFLENN